MKIEILCTDGSPLGPTSKTIWGDAHRIGVGGAEYALLTLCEAWTEAGHEVILYNDPWETGASPFEQRSRASFQPMEDRDILIVFRSPNPMAAVSKGLKCWFSCDQFTIGNFAGFAPLVDKIVCISPYHVQYFKDKYGIQNATCIDLPIRVRDFESKQVKRIPNRLIFTSVPARGLNELMPIWSEISKRKLDATLAITADYRLWGVPASNEQFRVKWMKQSNYFFFGAMPRSEYLDRLLEASILVYPCVYDELFCISVAEAQVTGCYPVTTDCGALVTTNMGTVIGGVNNKIFIDTIIELLDNPEELEKKRLEVQQKAKERFDPKRILMEWDEKVFK